MSVKTTDGKGRWRNKTVAFRLSPEENDLLGMRVALSGLTKQEFIARALLDPPLRVQATVRMRSAVQREVGRLCGELRRIRRAGDMGPELIEQVEALASFAGAFAETESGVDREDEMIRRMGRDGAIRPDAPAAPAPQGPEVRPHGGES